MVWLWLGFILFVLLLLALDLGVFHRHAHVVEVKEALLWSAVWVALALLFGVFVYFAYENHWFGLDVPGDASPGWAASLTYFSGYVLEKSLSVDNLFVIALIFSYFGVPPIYQHRLLVWGILGALVMRGALILVGALLIARFQWILYILGAFLVYTGVRMFFASPNPDPKDNRLVKLARRFLPVTDDFVGGHFVVRDKGRWSLTPLALALVVVESTDLVFAVDSIPAILRAHDGPVPDLHQQRVRDSGPAFPLLCVGGDDRPVSLLEAVAGFAPGSYWAQDAVQRLSARHTGSHLLHIGRPLP